MSSTPSTSASMDGRPASGVALNGSANGPHPQTAASEHDGGYEGTDASSSFSNATGCNPTLYRTHNEDIVHHLYNSGFQTGNYADTMLQVHKNTYRLHAIILSRSPYLAHLMSTSPQTGAQRVVYVPVEHEPEITEEGFAIALGYLYSAVSLDLIRPENARATLAAGCLLGGMDELCTYCYEICRRSITVENFSQWLDFVDRTSPSSDGTSTPTTVTEPPSSIFGLYAQRLRDDVFGFLVVTLPNILQVQVQSPGASDDRAPSVSGGRDTLLQIFSRVPFDMFKAAVESPTFQIGSDQSRFKFAKDAIELRKRGVARGTGAEETVVLAFGGNAHGGSAVHVTRKTKKRPLWKVNA